MMLARVALVQFGVLVAFERLALACSFCGAKGASGLLENLLLVAAFWFGAGPDARGEAALGGGPSAGR